MAVVRGDPGVPGGRRHRGQHERHRVSRRAACRACPTPGRRSWCAATATRTTLAKAGDVLEMFSDTGDIHTPVYTQDLSGTIVEADQPVVSYGGHGCTFIPQDKKACDHLESSMFPVQSLGTDYIVTMPHTPHGEHEWVRIMAFYDNTKVAFDPPVSGTNGAVLERRRRARSAGRRRSPSRCAPTGASSWRTTSSASSHAARRRRRAHARPRRPERVPGHHHLAVPLDVHVPRAELVRARTGSTSWPPPAPTDHARRDRHPGERLPAGRQPALRRRPRAAPSRPAGALDHERRRPSASTSTATARARATCTRAASTCACSTSRRRPAQ